MAKGIEPVTGIRAYETSDRADVRMISFRTGFMGDSAASFWRHEESWADVWTSYYTDREPQSLSVATLEGRVVGYLAGCRNTAGMSPNTDELISAAIRKHRLVARRGTAGFIVRAMMDSLRDRGRASGDFSDERWPAHLHIDLLPEARGLGLGAALMARWLDQLRADGPRGCHLATLVENERACGFFRKFGFRDHGEPTLVPGLRDFSGQRLHQQIMVRDARAESP